MKQIDNSWFFQKAEEVLKIGEQVKIRLVGHSMYPFLNSDKDLLTIAPIIPERLHVGDIVLAKVSGKYILHRLIGKTKLCWCSLQGDANIEKKELVHIKNIIGVLVLIERSGTQRIDCRSRMWRFNGWCWMKLKFCRSLLLKILALKRHLKKRLVTNYGE